MPNELPVVFDNGSSYDYYFINKELANKFEGKFECLGKNPENYKTFKTKPYKIKFIDSARSMAISLSNLDDSLAERNS